MASESLEGDTDPLHDLTADDIQHAEDVFGKNKLVTKSPRVQPYQSHLGLAANITYDNWRDIGKSIVDLRKSTHFWIGDWLVFGAEHYGEKYSQGASELGLKESTLVQYAYVARAYPKEQRHPNLTWRHHQIVAGEGDKEVRDHLLQHAEENDLSCRDLMKHYKNYKRSLGGQPTKSLEAFYCCPDCGAVIPESKLPELLQKENESQDAETSDRAGDGSV